MPKDSKFNKLFSDVFEFDDWTLFVSAELYSLEEAKKMFSDEIKERKTRLHPLVQKWEIFQTFVKARYDFEEKGTTRRVDSPKELTNFHKPVWWMNTTFIRKQL